MAKGMGCITTLKRLQESPRLDALLSSLLRAVLIAPLLTVANTKPPHSLSRVKLCLSRL